MADELNTPTHRWYQRRYNIALSPNEVSPKWILAAGIAKINAWIASLAGYAVNGFDPALVFDFKGNYFRKGSSASTFGASITHAASTNATMVDSDGLLKWRPHNLQVQSGDFSNSAWSKSAVTVDRSYVAPDGTSTASKLTSTGASGATGLYDSNPIGTGMSLTCFMKAGSSGVYGWIEGIVGGASPYAVFDLESGTVVHSRSCDASIEPVGNGWFRCVVANTTISISFFSVGGSDNTYASGPWGSSDLTQDKFIYAWGAQLEAGATQSSYISTTSASATRAAETLTVPAANLPYNSTNMSIQMDGKMTYADGNDSVEAEFYRWEVDSSNVVRAFLRTNSSNTGQVEFRQVAAGTSDTAASSGTLYSPATNVPFNIAGRHGSTFINGAADGTAFTANNTPVALVDLSTTDFKLGLEIMGTIGQFRMWDEDITDAGITEAST